MHVRCTESRDQGGNSEGATQNTGLLVQTAVSQVNYKAAEQEDAAEKNKQTKKKLDKQNRAL